MTLEGQPERLTPLQKILTGDSQSRPLETRQPEMTVEEVEMAKFLLQNGAKVNIFQSKTYPPLHIAVMRHSTDMVLILLQCGADINCTDSTGLTALGVACVHYRGKLFS